VLETIKDNATIPITVDDKETFLRLLGEHGGIIRKVAASYSRGVADRHDLMQEITLQLWKAYPRYSPDRPFSTWAYRIALNVAISSLRRSSHPARQTVSLDESEIEIADEITNLVETDERIPILRQVIASLPPLDRALLLLYLDDHSYREIAAILGITETNVATKLSRLKQTVRRDITKLTGN
jgi:RNA polymerase sigma-70 factor, ECF subfamily